MFELWRAVFTRDQRVIPSRFLEKLRSEMARALDGRLGGVYKPLALIKLLGAGLSINPLVSAVVTGLWTRRGTARYPMRVERTAPTTGDETVRGAALSDIIEIDGSGQTGARDVIVTVTSSGLLGEVVMLVLDPPHGSHPLDIITQGVVAPLITLGGGVGADPEWVALWFDPTRTGTNADGEWAVLARGDV